MLRSRTINPFLAKKMHSDASFPSRNALKSVHGPCGQAVVGGQYKRVFYSPVNTQSATAWLGGSAQPGIWAQFIQAKLVCLSTTIKLIFTDTFLGLYTLSTPLTTSPTTFEFIKNH